MSTGAEMAACSFIARELKQISPVVSYVCLTSLRKKNSRSPGLRDATSRNQDSLHQEHLTGTLDRAVELPLIMRRQPGVLARQDAAVIGHELLEQSDVLEFQRINGEINFRLGPGCAFFHAAGAAAAFAAFAFLCVRLTGHIGYLISR